MRTHLSTWLLAANMANMLSAQLAATELNTWHSAVSNLSASTIIFRPELNVYGLTYNGGYIALETLMNAANASLGTNPTTVAARAARMYQGLLKNALDDVNNNRASFVQSTPCSFSFGED